ncbi:MAG: N-acetyl-gamma-glutamyl-phosphate reductase, partial [Candidatus Ranarchaeia archaeon]
KKKFEAFTVDKATKCDVIFLAVPHKASMTIVPQLIPCGIKIIDLSADFRLRDREIYERYYAPHSAPELIERAVIGLPELHKEEIKKASFAACLGCLATTTILGLAPIVKSKKVDLTKIIVDAKIGSSAQGRSPTKSSHHPERMGVIRGYKLSGHRHTAEIEQELRWVSGEEQLTVSFSSHAVNLIRGILCTIHLFPVESLENKDLWKLYREMYNDDPFIRIVVQPQGLYKLPDPKYVVGSNFCDIGFEIDQHSPRIIVLSALDNLIKGSGGQAIQCMNLMCGLDEKTGLWMAGYYP